MTLRCLVASARVQLGKALSSLALSVVLLSSIFLTDVVATPPPGTPIPDEVAVDARDSGKHVQLRDGQVLAITLDSNPSTGYVWAPEGLDEAVLRQTWDSQFSQQSTMFGAPAAQTLRFEARAAGEATLNLVYRRPWEKDLMSGQAAPSFSIRVEGVGQFSPGEGPSATPTPELQMDVESAADTAGEPVLGLPSQFNWCDQAEGCPPVRNQGSCGSCWAFAAVGALETNILIRDTLSKDLSEQYLVSCNTDGWGCNGGWWAHDYHQWKVPPGEPDAGAVYESDFPYVGWEISCNPPHTHHEKITSWGYVGPQNDVASTSDIKQAIYDYGPVAVGVCSGSFGGYTGGVFTTDDTSSCGGTVDHAVVLTGWDDSESIWYLRNSWGTWWGDDGYMRIRYGVSNVGYAATYVVYESTEPTSTPTATHTPTSTSTPTRTPTPTATFPPGTIVPRAYVPHVRKSEHVSSTPTPTATTPSQQSEEMVQNGDFESGRTVWEEDSEYQLIYEDENPRGGTWSAWLGGYENADDRLYQDIGIPTWAQAARLQFYLYVQSSDHDWPYDFFHGELQTTSGSTLRSFGEADNTWESQDWYFITQDWTDFTPHAGTQRRLFFQGTTDESLNTDFFVDDVSFVVYPTSLGSAVGGHGIADEGRDNRPVW